MSLSTAVYGKFVEPDPAHEYYGEPAVVLVPVENRTPQVSESDGESDEEGRTYDAYVRGAESYLEGLLHLLRGIFDDVDKVPKAQDATLWYKTRVGVERLITSYTEEKGKNNQLTEANQKYVKNIGRLQTRIGTMTTELVKKNEAIADHDNAIKKLNGKLGKLRTEHSTDLSKLRHVHKTAMDDQKRKLNQECKIKVASVQNELNLKSRSEQKQARELKSLQAEHSLGIKQLQRLEQTHSTILQTREDGHSRDMVTLRRGHSTEIENLRTEYSRDHSTAMEDLRTQHSQQIERLMQDHLAEMEDRLAQCRAEVLAETSKLDRTPIEDQAIRDDQCTISSVAFPDEFDYFQPKPDITFKTEFLSIKNAIEGFSRCDAYISKGELGECFNQPEFANRMTMGKESAWLLEHAIWRILYERFYATPFQVYGKHGDKYFDDWCGLYSKMEPLNKPNLQWPEAAIGTERWRCETTAALRLALNTHPQLSQSYENNILACVKEVKEAIQKASAIPVEDSTDKILKVVSQAAQMAKDFGIQRCRMRLFTYEGGVTFKGQGNGEIFDRNGANSAEFGDRRDDVMVVQLAIVPGILRQGDGRGSWLDRDFAYLVPADVFLTK